MDYRNQLLARQQHLETTRTTSWQTPNILAYQGRAGKPISASFSNWVDTVHQQTSSPVRTYRKLAS